MSPVSADAKVPASTRILAAARSLVAAGGAAQVSMGDVAAHAGVSKALVHYHFHDKDSLLRALVDDVGAAVVQRERDAAAREPAEHALDAYWEFIAGEVRGGDLRILAALSEYDSVTVRESARRIARARREATAEHVTVLFTRLGLSPRIPASIVADAVVAFVDGLAIATALEPGRDPRPAFDVLWLALLTLSE